MGTSSDESSDGRCLWLRLKKGGPKKKKKKKGGPEFLDKRNKD